MTRPPLSRLLALVLSVLGAVLFVLSLTRPWWGMVMYAPQYPQGLITVATLTGLSGDVEELDGLNHYIGMMPLNDAAQVEKALAPYVVWASALLAVGACLVRRPLAAWALRLPLITFPVLFLADLKFWLWYAGNHLDPKAALSSTIKAFTPVLLGEGKIAQFVTQAWLEPGFWWAVAGAVLVIVAGGVGRAGTVAAGARGGSRPGATGGSGAGFHTAKRVAAGR
jgi:copper chaperone NosL